ncbi:transcriptional regulator [Salmonella sp. NCTC 11881]|nr:transcriptional regulator [Salmonella sp. NCTC 11881]
MRSLADFEFNNAPLCDGMILASEMIRLDFPTQFVYDELERLVSLAQEEISQLLSQDEQLEKIAGTFFTASGGSRIPAASTVFLMLYGSIKS